MRLGIVAGLLPWLAGCSVGDAAYEKGGGDAGGSSAGASGSAGQDGNLSGGGNDASGGSAVGEGGGPVLNGDCEPDAQRCSDLQPEVCDEAGHWQASGEVCASACIGGDCVEGCAEGDRACNGLQPRECDADGQWQNSGEACATLCSKGDCGACAPLSMRCDDLQPQQCDDTGAWVDSGDVCENACSSGVCTSGVCSPSSTQCRALQPELCDTTGEWKDLGTVCPSVCNGGSCAACTPGAKKCNGLQPQTCDANGAWQNTGSACGTCSVCSAGACGAAANGASCDDKNACTRSSSCQGGSCMGANPVVCTATDVCHVVGTCNTTTGACSTPNAPDTTTCSSGVGRCASGSCSLPRFASFGPLTTVADISADGRVVVGSSPSLRSFRWTLAGGIVALPLLSNAAECTVSGISADGSYSVGNCDAAAVRWNGTSAPIDLGNPIGCESGTARSVSSNGSIIGGTARLFGGADVATIWTVGAQPITIAGAADVVSSRGTALSADGAVLVGTASLSGGDQVFRWTRAAGMQLIPYLSGETAAYAADMSSDGTRIVGTDSRPFLWSSGTLSRVGTSVGSARAISGDGTTVISSDVSTTIGGDTQLIAARLGAAGVDLTGVQLADVYALSANGKVILGVAYRGREGSAFIATLP